RHRRVMGRTELGNLLRDRGATNLGIGRRDCPAAVLVDAGAAEGREVVPIERLRAGERLGVPVPVAAVVRLPERDVDMRETAVAATAGLRDCAEPLPLHDRLTGGQAGRPSA